MTTTTATHRGHKLTTIFDRHNVSIPPDLAADIDVPVLTGPQRQGDVGIFPRPPAGAAELTSMSPIPAEGVRVVRGEATGNAHILHADGPAVLWSPSSNGLRLGVLHVPAGSTAWLIHTDEHGANGIGAGTFVLTGKREQADEIRRVAD